MYCTSVVTEILDVNDSEKFIFLSYILMYELNISWTLIFSLLRCKSVIYSYAFIKFLSMICLYETTKNKKNHSSFYTINFINLSNILISYGISFPNSICALMVGKYINKEKSLLNTCKILLRFFVELFFIKYFKMYLMRLSSHILGQLTSLNPPDPYRKQVYIIQIYKN